MITKDRFMAASLAEAQEILSFYHSFIGSEGCTWDAGYPAMEHVRMDIEKGNLFLVRDEKGIVATISIDSDEQVDALGNWTIANSREAARLAVRNDLQGQGIARDMLRLLMEELKEQGYEGLHFLVSPGNPAALASYAKLAFANRGVVNMYGHEWFCYEKRL